MATHLQQPKRSRTCGQHCIAMLAGVEPQAVITKSKMSGGTSVERLLAIAKMFGLRAASQLWLVRDFEQLPSDAILKLRKAGSPVKRWHWACVVDGVIHDPACSVAGEIVKGYSIVAVMPMRKA